MAQITIIESICDVCNRGDRGDEVTVTSHTVRIDRKAAVTIDACDDANGGGCWNEVPLPRLLAAGTSTKRLRPAS